jgi:hypothetical protein
MTQIDPELLKRLDALAAKLGTTADQIIAILRQQAHVEVVVDCLAVVGGLCLAMLYAAWLRYLLRKTNGDIFDGTVVEFLGAIIGGGACVVLAISSAVAVFELPTLLLNPDYWVFEQLRHLF